ncbi:hypothetical protein Taro_026990 [Colocasia esculenta]|uniref:Uncharacterized protein n=1 Tax=Colocasia esculenta TaxID=4460 RepID=A0A843VGS4_COLES|nr:hypothetical protein [Colocasia esculenta]
MECVRSRRNGRNAPHPHLSIPPSATAFTLLPTDHAIPLEFPAHGLLFFVVFFVGREGFRTVFRELAIPSSFLGTRTVVGCLLPFDSGGFGGAVGLVSSPPGQACDLSFPTTDLYMDVD